MRVRIFSMAAGSYSADFGVKRLRSDFFAVRHRCKAGL